MSRSGKTPDGKGFVVHRPLLPAGFASGAVKKTVEPRSSSSSSANPLANLIARAVIMLTVGLLLLPISLLFRVALRRGTVEAIVGDRTTGWRAPSRAAAGAGVEAVADALTRGAPLNQQFAGLTPRG